MLDLEEDLGGVNRLDTELLEVPAATAGLVAANLDQHVTVNAALREVVAVVVVCPTKGGEPSRSFADGPSLDRVRARWRSNGPRVTRLTSAVVLVPLG